MEEIAKFSQQELRRFDSRTRTMSENDSSYGEERVFPKNLAQDDKQRQSKQRCEIPDEGENASADSEEETFRELIQRRVVINQRRPMLQRKIHSDLSAYRNTKIKILVEGEELSGKDMERRCSSNEFNSSLQESSFNTDHIAEVQQERFDKKKPRSLVGWFAKSHSKTCDLKNAEETSVEKSEKRSPFLKRSGSFSGRIRDKFKMSFTSAKQAPKSEFLKPPNMFFRSNVERNIVNGVGVTQFGFQRRHSDQTDSILRRPLGGRGDVKACPAYYSLDRGLRQMSAKKPLTRKRSNSFEKEDDFPFWSQISDTNRSRSCSARISVTEQLDTHRDNDGMLETNLCSTEL